MLQANFKCASMRTWISRVPVFFHPMRLCFSTNNYKKMQTKEYRISPNTRVRIAQNTKTTPNTRVKISQHIQTTTHTSETHTTSKEKEHDSSSLMQKTVDIGAVNFIRRVYYTTGVGVFGSLLTAQMCNILGVATLDSWTTTLGGFVGAIVSIFAIYAIPYQTKWTRTDKCSTFLT